jgi:hypothetical protein
MATYDVEALYQRVIERVTPEEKLLQVEMVGLGDVTENVPNLEREKKDVRKKVFTVFVELTQNVMHHAAQPASGIQRPGTGVVVIIEKKHAYEIISGNIVENGRAQDVVRRCQQLSSANVEELKALYREQRKRPVPLGAKGSGLGLIDIARKSGNAIQAVVEKIDEKVSFLELSVMINKDH